MFFSSLTKYTLAAVATMLLLLCSRSAFSQSATATSLGTVAEDIYKTSRQRVYAFSISATGGDATISALTTQATGGNYTSGDIVNFGLYFNTVNDFNSATLIGTSGLSAGFGESINFGSLSQVITGDGFDRFLFIAANVAPGATPGATFSIPFFDNSNFTFTTLVTLSATLGPSGTKTIQNAITFTSLPTPNANNVAVNASIELDFDTDVDLLSVHGGTINPDDVYDDNIKVAGSQSGQLTGVFSTGSDNSVILFDPAISFKAGEKITVTVNSRVLGTGGQAATNRSFSFIAASGPFEGAFIEVSTSGILGVTNGDSDWGDYDNDGDLDLVTVGWDPSYNEVAIIYNNAGGVFTDIGAGLTGVFYSSCQWGDYDGDGDLDLVVAGSDASVIRSTVIYENNGGVFTDISAGLIGVDYASVAWGDYDNDGDLDLAVAGRNSTGPEINSTTIYRNDGGGSFVDIGAGLLGLSVGSIDWADVDGDGDLDLHVTGFDDVTPIPGRFATVYRNEGGDIFVDASAGLPGVGYSAADWGDYDNDGDLDLVMMGGQNTSNDGAYIYRNDGGVFTDIGAGFSDKFEDGSAKWGDYDGDGDLDVVFTGQDFEVSEYVARVYKNDGGLFTDILANLIGVAEQSTGNWADYDGDGDLDLLLTGVDNLTFDPSARLYENTIFNAFVTTWKTDNPGASNDDQITIPTTGAGYFYNVNWGDGMTDTDLTGTITHTYASPGTYTVSITGAFPRIFFNGSGDREKILTVEQWGDIAWTSMASAFRGCSNLTIPASDAPDLAAVTDLSSMFRGASVLNSNIDSWNVSSVTTMNRMFQDAVSFNQPLNSWNVSNVTDMGNMFFFASVFDQDLSNWTVDNVTNMSSMFGGARVFNGNVSTWHVDNVTNMSGMFSVAEAFNQNIGAWQITNVSSLSGMFNGAIAFNQDISFKSGGGNNGGDAWNTNGVFSMAAMFKGAVSFVQPITNWDVSTVTTMREMFADHSAFNQNIASWTVSNVTNMEDMFSGATSFNQNIGGWDVAKVADMSGLFERATAFNQNISGWNVGLVTDMRLMFQDASSFDQDLSTWDIASLSLAVNMFNNSGLSVANYDKLLEGWAAQTVKPNVSFGAQGIFYCSAQAARDVLTNAANSWFITDSGPKCISIFNGPDTASPQVAASQTLDYGSTSTTKSKSFTLLNNQGITITNVQIMNPGTGFPTSLAFSSIAPGGTQTFTIDLTGPVGTYAETVTITSSDFTGSFQFSVTGEVTLTPGPEIAVFEGPTGSGTPILNGQIAAFALGTEVLGNSLLRDISITNLGDADLNISDISFPAGSEIQLVSIPPTIVAVNATEIIQIQITGANGGQFLETLTITSDDADESIFSFNVFADIIGPDMLIVDGLDIFSDPEILNGQVAPVNIGTGPFGGPVSKQLTITAFTNANLAVSNISITGTAFTFTPAAPLNIAGELDGIYDEVPFEITLSGTVAGTFNETVTITSDDLVDPIFVFPITGTITGGVCSVLPTVDAGADVALCSGTTVQLAGSFGGSANMATWSTAGTGTFDDSGILNAVYTLSAADISNGSVVLTLTVPAAGPCPQVQDQLTVSVSNNPIAGSPVVQSNINTPNTIDVISASTIQSGDVITITIQQNPTKGSAVVNTDNSITYSPSVGTIGADSFDYEICNQCGLCSQGTVTIDIANAVPIFTAPTTTPQVIPGESIVISIPSVVSDLNGNIDLTSFSNFSSTVNAAFSYDPATGELTVDYTNVAFTAAQDNISFSICDLLNACVDVTLQVDLNGEITVFNGVSPNGDGMNEYFNIQSIQFIEPINNVTIYNRWGDKVFEMDGYNPDIPEKRFEGKQNNGKELPSGIYFYKVEFNSGRSELTGYLTLKR